MASKEELRRLLTRSLEQIDGTADMICQGVDLFDPDALEQNLDQETQQVERLLARLMTDPTRGPLAESGHVPDGQPQRH